MKTVIKFILIFIIFVVTLFVGNSLSENIERNDAKNEFILLTLKTLQNNNAETRMIALTQIRKKLLFADENDGFIVKENFEEFVPLIIKCLKSSNPRLQYEAIITLSDLITSMPELTDTIIDDSEAIPKLIKLISNKFTYESAVALLAKMISQKPDELRQKYLNLEIIVPILLSFSPFDAATFNENVKTIIIKLFEEKNQPPEDDLGMIIPIWAKLIHEFDASTVLKTIETIGHLSKEEEGLEKYVVDKDVIYSMVNLINDDEIYLRRYLAVGLFYITQGSAEQIQHIFDAGFLKYFGIFLNDENEQTNLCGMVLISNVLNKSESQYQAVFDSKYIPEIMEYFKSDSDDKQQVATKFFTRALIYGKTEHILHFLKMNVVCYLSIRLNKYENGTDEKWINGILKSFATIFEKLPKSEMTKLVALEIAKCGGGNDIITKFVKHENSEISELAVKIIYEMGQAMDILDSQNSFLRDDL